MRQDQVFHPDFKATPYWWDAAPPDPTRHPLPDAVDVAVVGSGYCGLVAAIELAEAGRSVAVLEAEALGSGASSRNGGMVSCGLKLPEGLEQRVGKEEVAHFVSDAHDGFDFIERLISERGLDAEYTRPGRFICAHTPAAFRHLAGRAEWLSRVAGYHATVVPKSQQRDYIGSDLYHGGIFVEEVGQLHPAKYHRALRQAAAGAGVQLCGFAPVRAILREGESFRLLTGRGDLRAGRVFVATNGYTGSVTPYLRRRLIPMASYVIATEDLPEAAMQQLCPGGRGYDDTKRILYYFRPSPDRKKIVFGGRAKFSDQPEQEAAATIHGFMTQVWPELARTRITHAWKGNVAFTFDFLPHMGQHEGVDYAVGCQGNGVAMMTYLGHRAAGRILRRDNATPAYERADFPTRPLYYGKPWFMPVVGNYYRLRDRLDRVFSR